MRRKFSWCVESTPSCSLSAWLASHLPFAEKCRKCIPLFLSLSLGVFNAVRQCSITFRRLDLYVRGCRLHSQMGHSLGFSICRLDRMHPFHFISLLHGKFIHGDCSTAAQGSRMRPFCARGLEAAPW